MQLRALLPIAFLGGCAEWPRHEHLPALDQSAASADVNPRVAMSDRIDWVEHGSLGEPYDPGSNSDTLGHFEGVIFEGGLDAWGWNPNVVADRTGNPDCGDVWAFPPEAEGDYAGDVDWVSILPAKAGTLCASIELGLDTSAVAEADLRYDVLLYTLNACDEPVQAVHDSELGRQVGLTLGGIEGEWGANVPGAGNLGIALAGWGPEDRTDLVATWRLGLSLVPSTSDGELGTCPFLPEAR